MKRTLRRSCGWVLVIGACLASVLGCSKENNVVKGCSSPPAGTCPEGFSAIVTSNETIEQCQQDGEGTCKKVGSCTIRCEDPRGCTAVGSVCGDDSLPACCGEAAGENSCVRFGSDDPKKVVRVCSKRCTANADCPGSCCDASINNGAFAVCAPYDVCLAGSHGAPPAACVECLHQMCPDVLERCMADETCNGCLSGDIYLHSPDCRNNAAFTKGYGCTMSKCPNECMP